MKHRRGKWMECAVASIGVTAVSKIDSHKSLAAAHLTHPMSLSYVWNLWHRIPIAVQDDAHNIDNTSDGCSVACTPAVQSYNSSVITHPIIYFIAPNNAIMTYMTSVPMIFPSPHFHNQHNKSIRRWLISICILYHLGAIYTHTHSHTQSPTHLHYLAVLRNSPHKRNNLAC